MNIVISEHNANEWDLFLKENYPPVGAFMQTWAWGTFQKSLGRTVSRYSVMDGNTLLAIFTLVQFKLRFSLSYGYMPRGPVVLRETDPKKIAPLFKTIEEWSKKKFPHLIFLRLEPPLPPRNEFKTIGLHLPIYYIQPKHNAIVDLKRSEKDILASFHSSTRSNIKRAEKRKVTVVIKNDVTPAQYHAFILMMQDTMKRNKGKNAYPNDNYFRSLFKEVPLTTFLAFHEGKPASTHFVLFFGKTVTYLYGASHTSHLPSKVDTYLHWMAIKEGKRRGYEYYDLGGVDEKRWPSLTTYKRQFRGEELEYMGNIDITSRLCLYRMYSFLRRMKILIEKIASRIGRR